MMSWLNRLSKVQLTGHANTPVQRQSIHVRQRGTMGIWPGISRLPCLPHEDSTCLFLQAITNIYIFSLQHFNVEIVSDSQEVSKSVPCTLHPASPNYILRNQSACQNQGIDVGVRCQPRHRPYMDFIHFYVLSF